MARTPRRNRRILQSTEVVGILPAEEAALNRALYASLQDDKATPPDPSNATQTSSSSSSSTPSQADSSFLTPSKRRKMDPVEEEEEEEEEDPLLSPLFPLDSLRSSVSPHFSVDTVSSTLSSPASIESSLKLILSTSSWTSSNESDWSPSTPVHSPLVVAPPVKRGRGRPRKHPKLVALSKSGRPAVNTSSNTSSSPDVALSAAKASPKKRLVMSTPSKSKSPKAVDHKKTWPKSPKHTTPNKGGKKATPITAAGGKVTIATASDQRKRKQPKSATTTPSRSNNNSQTPTSDHQTTTVSSDQTLGQDQRSGSSCSSSGSPSTLKAQRKFAQNHVSSPQSQVCDDGSEAGGRRLKEVPQTEDFIAFLCLRSCMAVPKSLDVFNTPWSGVKKQTTRKSLKQKSQFGAPKKLEFSPKALNTINPATTH